MYIMNYGLVSIITPCHNSARHIRACIESVIAQDYPHWEMLITDDGSTDNSAEIIGEYAKKDSRIRLFRMDNASGTPAAPRNNSIENARGEYIAFLDSDDVWLPNKLSEQLYFAESNNYDIVYSYYEKISNDGVRKGKIVMTDSCYDYGKIIKTDGIPWLTLMMRRSVFGDYKFLPVSKEDYICLMSLLRKGYVAYNTKQVHALYRETGFSRSSNKFRMLQSQWVAIRKYESLGFLKSLLCMTVYAFNGIRKKIV